MNREDVIRLAKEAGLFSSDNLCITVSVDMAGRFAALVASAERERCAKVCDGLHFKWRFEDDSGPKECADDIRALGDE